MQMGQKIDKIGASACIPYTTIYCFFLQIFRFLDVSNASSMPHLLRNLILMILFFYRSILSSLEAEKCVEFNFTM